MKNAVSSKAAATQLRRDPVCGMNVAENKAAGKVEHQGQTYYFCGASCIAKFKADPPKYMEPIPTAKAVPPAHSQKPVEYTCPMHPDRTLSHLRDGFRTP